MTSISFIRLGLAGAIASLGLAVGCSSDENGTSGSDAGADSGGPDSSSGAGGTAGSGGSGGSSGAGGTSGAGGVGGSGGSDGGPMCTTPLALPCDGPEDCASGQSCCAKFEGNGYVEVGCFDSCLAQQGDAQPGPGGGAYWFDLCHAGDTCEDPMASCTSSTYLPSSLARCIPPGLAPVEGDPADPSLGKGAKEVNCGAETCGEGEQCCLRQPLEPYCAPAGATCQCELPEAGMPGGDAALDASPDGAPDASSDASADAAMDAAADGSMDAAPDGAVGDSATD